MVPCTTIWLALLGLASWVEAASLRKEAKVSEQPTGDQHRHVLSWDTYWVESGLCETQQAEVTLPYGLVHQEHVLRGDPPRPKRPRRMIFGADDRIRVDPAADGQKYPFSAVIRVSTGCSGLLVSARHVLTAAHCLHDGTAYIPSALLFLRVGYLERDGMTKWHFARRFFVSSYWKNTTRGAEHQYSNWDNYDFAVIELAEELGESRGFIKPGFSGLLCDNHKSVEGVGAQLQYVSFPDDKSREALWYAETNVTTETPGLLYFTGDAWHGSSGAGLYTWHYDADSKSYERRVVGVLSGNRNTESSARVQGNFNVAARLTAANLMQVCRWIEKEGECMDRYSKYLDARKLAQFCQQ